MTDPDDPGRFLVEHRAPDDLLHRALSQVDRPERPPLWIRALPTVVAAAAALVVGISAGWTARGAAPVPAPLPPPPPTVLVASAPAAPVPVRLVIHAPDASSVAVAGSFNGWNAESVPLQRADDGTWHTTLRLPSGRYEYLFVLDGTEWVGDPTAPLTAPDDFGQANAILEV